MAGEFVDAPAPQSSASGTGQFVDAPAPTENFLTKAAKAVKKGVKVVDKKVGGALVYGHDHPFEAFMNVAGAPQRGLQYLETMPNGQGLAKSAGGAWDAMTHPKQGRALTTAAKEKFGIGALERGPLAGNDLPHKFARGVVDTGLDIVNDPVSFAPVGKAAKLLGKVAPPLAKAAGAVGKFAKETPVGKFLDPEAPLQGLTTEGKATFQTITNRAREKAYEVGRQQHDVVKTHAEAIRSGVIPPEVKALFTSAKNVPEAKKGLRPQEVDEALARDRNIVMKQTMNRDLRNAGFLTAGKGKVKVNLKDPGQFFEDPTKIADTRTALGKVVNPRGQEQNDLLKAARGLTQAGNKAFLALPFPHGFNLANLAYNNYGIPTTLKGLGNAARVATGTVGKGDLANNIAELDKLGAKSQYHNVFDELGLTRVAGIPGSEGAAKVVNKALLPAQRFSNKLQNVFLNPLETGLRASALDAEKKAGATGVEAARNLHKAFGTDAPNRLTKAAQDIGTPFAKFHAQTSIGSGLKTLATNPGRITSTVKAQRDMNNEVNPHGPEFRMSVPGLNTARAFADPLHYFSTLAGPISGLQGDFSSLTAAEKGKVSAAVSQIIGRYVPAQEAFEIMKNAATGERGKAGEKAASDLPNIITGGYYVKRKP